MICFLVSAVIILTADFGGAGSVLPLGQISHVNVSEQHPVSVRFSFTPTTTWVNQQDVRIRIQVGAFGRRGHRPSKARPVTVTALISNAALSWTLPWRATTPDTEPYGFVSEWRQIITCQPLLHGEEQAAQSVQLTARTASLVPLGVEWRADSESVTVNRRAIMKSHVSDISYKHYSWHEHEQELRIEAETIRGHCVCASLIVTDYCTENPYNIQSNDHHLLVNFTISAKFTVQRRHLPKDFYLYLLPQWNDRYCQQTRLFVNKQHLSKTVEILILPRSFLHHNEEAVVVDGQQQLGVRTPLCESS